MKNKTISRRSFLERSAALSAAVALPSAIAGGMTSCASTAEAGKECTKDVIKTPRITPKDQKVKIACIGIGNRANGVIKAMFNSGICEVVALCDTQMGAKHTLEIMEKFPDAERFQNFREMFAKAGDKFDAVVACTPDHAHFACCMMAMKEGKHIYVEKPLARTFNECQLLMDAEKKYGVVTQMGNQGHSEANYFQFKAWKDAGIIKDVTHIDAHMNFSRRWHKWDPKITNFPEAQPVPVEMDWNTWIMTSTFHEYNSKYINGDWRCWYDYGLGALGDWGAHIIDTAHQFLELGLPYEVEPLLLKDHNPYFFPMSTTLNFKFAARKDMPAMDITWYDGIDNFPKVPVGYGQSKQDANIPASGDQKFQTVQKLSPGKIIYSKELTFKGGSHGTTLEIIPAAKAEEMKSKLPEVPKTPCNHYKNFLLACRGEMQTHSPFSVSGPLAQTLCLGVIAQQVGSKIIFDAEKRQITNNSFANLLLTGVPPRKGWEDLFEI